MALQPQPSNGHGFAQSTFDAWLHLRSGLGMHWPKTPSSCASRAVRVSGESDKS
jgi:hypothetical protein